MMFSWILDRLTERSTWRGLVTGATGIGLISLGPELRDLVITGGLSLFGAIEIIFTENGGTDAE